MSITVTVQLQEQLEELDSEQQGIRILYHYTLRIQRKRERVSKAVILKLQDTQYKHTTPASSTLVLNPQKRHTLSLSSLQISILQATT